MSAPEPVVDAPALSCSYERDLEELGGFLEAGDFAEAARIAAGLPEKLPLWVEELRREGAPEPRLREQLARVEDLLRICRGRGEALSGELRALRGQQQFLEEADRIEGGGWVSGRV